ncbi:hypothetical protein DFJ58DRAFT_842985 [Suillus subalutaceus]|uniref:uncharacterized protein n=1 Tax=Suillus subalutaceus TaxID=48586 RepID=UPI001B88638D|nr:uncharacterized protein DFJ58DRAFT_842985 [Suillus subalutaceus]KAG1848044.1 hypothetical protein DFJ58DRAFT_842985 [Suillus subalutaceus]
MARLEVFALVLQMQQFAGTGSSTLWTRVLHVSSLVLEKQAATLVWSGSWPPPGAKDCEREHSSLPDEKGGRCTLLVVPGDEWGFWIGQPWSTEGVSVGLGIHASWMWGVENEGKSKREAMGKRMANPRKHMEHMDLLYYILCRV